MLDEIYKKAKCEKQKLEIQGAGHGESSEVNHCRNSRNTYR